MCPVLNRVRGDMRIVCLITVSAFLLSKAIADSDVPIGSSQYQHGPRAILLEPILKMNPNTEENPINWFFNMISKAVEHPKKPPPAIIGPINLPGTAGQIYIRQKENILSPWQSKHVTIKLVTRDPITGNSLPIDYSSSLNHQWDDPYRRNANPYNYQSVNNVFQSGFVPVSSAQPQYSSWHSHQYNRHQQYIPQYQKPFRPSPPNDFHHNYGREADQSYSNNGQYETHRRPSRMNYHNHFTPGVAKPMNAVPTASMYRSMAHQPYNPDGSYSRNEYNDRFKDNQVGEQANDFYAASGKSEPVRSTQLPYPDYPPLSKAENSSQHIEHTSASSFINSPGYSKQVVRTDRMVPTSGRRNNIRNNYRNKNIVSHNRGTNNRGFREGTKYGSNFGVRDVGGIEVITAPNLQDGWEGYDGGKNNNDDNVNVSGSVESDTVLDQEEDSISMENGEKLARGESKDHSNEQENQTEKNFVSRSENSKHSSYTIIDRSHRSQGSRSKNNTTENNNSKDIISGEKKDDNKDLSIETQLKAQVSSEQDTNTEPDKNLKKNTDVSAEVIQKVINLTTSKRRSSQAKRTPRVVKAIYRRKQVTGIIKNSEESTESSGSREEKSSEEILSSEN